MPTTIGDLVLVHMSEQPAFFARIEDIYPDIKKDWWQVKLLVLQLPLKTIVWILREPYIQGEIFTMGGTPLKIEKVVAPPEPPPAEGEERDPEPPEPLKLPPAPAGQPSGPKVISLKDRLKKNGPDNN
jgi:hypothetical protein